MAFELTRRRDGTGTPPKGRIPDEPTG